MQENSLQKDVINKNKSRSVGGWLYRHGIVFSAAMMAISLVSGISTQIASKLGINKTDKVEMASIEKSKHPYEKPSFHVFGSVIKDADAAMIVNAAT